MNSVVQKISESQALSGDASGAINGEETKPPAPRNLSPKRGRKPARAASVTSASTLATPPDPSETTSAVQIVDEPQLNVDGAGAALCAQQPIMAVPRRNSNGRKAKREASGLVIANETTPPANAKRGREAAGPAVPTPNPKPQALAQPKRSRHRHPYTHNDIAAAGPAIEISKPRFGTPGTSLSDGQYSRETHATVAVAGDDHSNSDAQATHVIATITELWRRRQSWHRAEKSLTLQAKAICRRYVGGDKDEAEKLFAGVVGQGRGGNHIPDAVTPAILPLLMARDMIEQHRAAVEKELERLAATLPIATWTESIRGFGNLSLAGLVGECGDIGTYKSVSAVWKRMGLAVINGERQRRVTGPDALEHGYSPQRRSFAWNIGVSLMRAQKVGQPYRDYYDSEKAKQLAKGLTKGHAHNRACRHMTKRFLAHLYGAWNPALSAVHLPSETHTESDGASAATNQSNPMAIVPRSNSPEVVI